VYIKMILVFVLLLGFCSIVMSFLYALGFIPGTGRYILKKIDVSKLSLKKLDKSCDLLEKWVAEVEDKKYFTFDGMKPINDLLSRSDENWIESVANACEGKKRGIIVEFDDFKREVEDMECDELVPTMSDYLSKAIIHDGEIISHIDAYEKIHPKSLEKCYENEE
jgi:hypothetical protein